MKTSSLLSAAVLLTLAQAAVASLDGVEEVVNRIEVLPPARA